MRRHTGISDSIVVSLSEFKLFWIFSVSFPEMQTEFKTILMVFGHRIF